MVVLVVVVDKHTSNDTCPPHYLDIEPYWVAVGNYGQIDNGSGGDDNRKNDKTGN